MSITASRSPAHSVHSATLADVLERVLDKGLVIAGDIKIKLVDIELLTIQIRLVVASVDKAREMGMDWWTNNADFQPALMAPADQAELVTLRERVARLESNAAASHSIA
ncbi:gas vesicle protein GvpJ (plasmid) [Tundrisphaera lichenicola]|uniref:gas vesicle protein GvpJ n=1 Tax=Tundrisphaera lichenicola TaxID=2029860 RepID=UPI003EB9B5C2